MRRLVCGCENGERCSKVSLCWAQNRLDEVIEQFQADAIRYRWLRSSRLEDFPPTEFGKGWWETLGGKEEWDFDEAIDKAILKEPT